MKADDQRLVKIANQSLADRARELIRKAIFEGTIKPEEKLTIERIATELGISRTPVREALKSLEMDGIVRILPNRGAIVQRFDKAELAQRYGLRALLEGYAGEFACKLAAAELYPVLQANVDEMRTKAAELVPGGPNDLDQIGGLLELNRAFHHAILEASGCTLVTKVLDSLQMPLAYRMYQWRLPARQKAVIDYHQLIVDAMRARNPAEVRRLMEAHVHDVRDFLLSTG